MLIQLKKINLMRYLITVEIGCLVHMFEEKASVLGKS